MQAHTSGHDPDIPFFHTVGIGSGPANLSVAALYDVLSPHEIALFERQPAAGWHEGMLHVGVRMQTGWVKDLVSLLDPTHPLSFLNYLVTTGRVYAMLGAGFDTIPRLEYSQYLMWASAQIPRVFYGTSVERVTFDGGFISHGAAGPLARSEHLVLGQGTTPHIPEWFAGIDPTQAVVADNLGTRIGTLDKDPDQPIVVVGSGQTSAECVSALMGAGYRNILWMGRRTWYAPLEESPAANDLYRPAYQQFFLGLSKEVRERLVSGQILTSDGISPGTLRGLYQSNYEARLRLGRFPVTVMPGRDVTGARMLGDEIEVTCVPSAGGEEHHRVRYLVLAGGRRQAPLPFDGELAEQVDRDDQGEPVIEADYSVRWKHADRHKIFALNRGRYVQGLVDSNLSILPIRSAQVINALAQRAVYSIRDEYVSTSWA